MIICHFCGKEQSSEAVYRNTLCSSCSRELKICYNCVHFDESAPRSCREPVAEEVRDKDRANFCDYFRGGKPSNISSAAGKSGEKASEARKAFDSLFGGEDS